MAEPTIVLRSPIKSATSTLRCSSPNPTLNSPTHSSTVIILKDNNNNDQQQQSSSSTNSSKNSSSSFSTYRIIFFLVFNKFLFSFLFVFQALKLFNRNFILPVIQDCIIWVIHVMLIVYYNYLGLKMKLYIYECLK